MNKKWRVFLFHAPVEFSVLENEPYIDRSVTFRLKKKNVEKEGKALLKNRKQCQTFILLYNSLSFWYYFFSENSNIIRNISLSETIFQTKRACFTMCTEIYVAVNNFWGPANQITERLREILEIIYLKIIKIPFRNSPINASTLCRTRMQLANCPVN